MQTGEIENRAADVAAASRAADVSPWIRGPIDRLAIKEGCYFDLAAALRVREFFEKHLRHATGEWAGKPFTLLDWQWRDVVAPLFGWKRADGRRRFNARISELRKEERQSGCKRRPGTVPAARRRRGRRGSYSRRRPIAIRRR
jgi:hypothetical protein